jgi:hypothetical protein
MPPGCGWLPSFAVWESVTVVLNVLAFTLIGLQLRPILEALSRPSGSTTCAPPW